MMLLATAFLVHKKGYNCLRNADTSNLYDLQCALCLKNLKIIPLLLKKFTTLLLSYNGRPGSTNSSNFPQSLLSSTMLSDDFFNSIFA